MAAHVTSLLQFIFEPSLLVIDHLPVDVIFRLQLLALGHYLLSNSHRIEWRLHVEACLVHQTLSIEDSTASSLMAKVR